MTANNTLTLDHMQGGWERAIKSGNSFTIKAFTDERGYLNWMIVTFERIDHRTGTWSPPVANESQS